MDNITSFLVVALVVLVLKFRASFRIARSGKHCLHPVHATSLTKLQSLIQQMHDGIR